MKLATESNLRAITGAVEGLDSVIVRQRVGRMAAR